jgi:hypothetical protein
MIKLGSCLKAHGDLLGAHSVANGLASDYIFGRLDYIWEVRGIRIYDSRGLY